MIKFAPKYNFIFGRNVNAVLYKETFLLRRKCCEKVNDGSTERENKKATDYPEEPTTCCMSGCPNCVWLEYAEKLSAYYQDGGERAIKEINEKVQDSNVRAFLLHELRMRNKS